MSKEERLARLKVDVDTRLLGLYELLWQTELYDRVDADDRELMTACLRAAYAVGRGDLAQEIAAGQLGAFARANGYTEGEAT